MCICVCVVERWGCGKREGCVGVLCRDGLVCERTYRESMRETHVFVCIEGERRLCLFVCVCVCVCRDWHVGVE